MAVWVQEKTGDPSPVPPLTKEDSDRQTLVRQAMIHNDHGWQVVWSGAMAFIATKGDERREFFAQEPKLSQRYPWWWRLLGRRRLDG